jgi:Bacterial Ig-like domain
LNFRIIELSKFPYPLLSTSPTDGTINNSTNYSNIQFNFSEKIDPASIQQAFNVTPKVTIDRFYYSTKKYFIFNTSFKLGTEYTVTLDTSLVSEYGEHLEFPASFSFKTENFKIEYINYPYSSYYSNAEITLRFNGVVNKNQKNLISIEPNIPIDYVEYSSNNILIRPNFGWQADTTFNITISKYFKEVNGATLENDTIISFTTPELQISKTRPTNGQNFINTESNIQIETNFILDENTIKDAINITPSINFDLTTYSNNGRTHFLIYPNQPFFSNTKYTVTINKSLTDYYGVPLSEEYNFSFTTKE